MTQITILDHVEFSDGSTNAITAHITNEGAVITYADVVYMVHWETMDDVEHLSNLFADSTVKVFKVAVQLLGRIYSGKDAYKLLV